MVKIYIQGELLGVKVSEYDGKKTTKLQFLVEDEKTGGSEIIDVKVNDENHLPTEELKRGMNIKTPIAITSMPQEGSKKINSYYRTTDKIQVSK